MDYESVKYVEGFVENIIFRNGDNGYTVFEIKYKGEDVTCVGTLSSVEKTSGTAGILHGRSERTEAERHFGEGKR